MQAKRKFRTRAVFLITVWILLLVVSLSLLSILLETFHSNPQSQSIVSLSWAGYIIAKDFVNPQLEVIAINASWVVPKVNASAGDGHSSAWIGIGGQSGKTLIQVGTEHNSLGGRENYYVWYELLPDFAVRVTDIAVSPEDTIVASITLINSDTNQWNIQISDVTNGQVFSNNVIYNSTRSSGEWILERPTVNEALKESVNDFLKKGVIVIGIGVETDRMGNSSTCTPRYTRKKTLSKSLGHCTLTHQPKRWRHSLKSNPWLMDWFVHFRLF